MGETDNKHSSCFSWLTSVNPQSPPESGVRLQIWKPGLTWTGLVRACARVHAQWYPSLCDPIDCSPPASSVRGLSQAGILELVAISSSRGSSCPTDLTCISCLAGDSLPAKPSRKPQIKPRELQMQRRCEPGPRRKMCFQIPGSERKAVSDNGLHCGYRTCLLTSH